MNNSLVKQIINRGIKDKRVIEAFSRVDRALFVPQSQQAEAYQDYPLPIGSRQTISQPTLVAHMTELLELKKSDKVLEIGTGSGYQTAILAELCKHVYTIEIIKPLFESGKTLLASLKYTNITVNHASGYEGWLENAPFDKVIVTCAPPKTPQALVDQLKIGGKMIIPVGVSNQELLIIEKGQSGSIHSREIFPVRFVPMTTEVQ